MNQSKPPNAGLEEDTKLVRETAEKLLGEGKEVIVLMHSYGGQVGSNALKGLSVEMRKQENLKGGVRHLIYMCAAAMPEHTSMMTKVREFGHEDLMPQAFDFAEDMSVLSRYPKLLIVSPPEGNAEMDQEANDYIATFKRWNGNCMYQDIQHCAWREIPVTYVETSNDMTLPLDYQKSMVKNMEEAGRRVDVVLLETGHCPNLTMTKEVAQIVENVAKH
ncbi:MAG: hypothetical protein Q9162_002534 [Coniocarpon cinnabarinum]